MKSEVRAQSNTVGRLRFFGGGDAREHPGGLLRLDPAFVERFAAICREGDPAGIDIAFCGPKGLAPKIREQMRANGVPDANLRYELFEFR